METTMLYVEHIIIGLSASVWLSAFFVYFTSLESVEMIKYALEKIPASVFLLGAMYLLGILVDRAADLLTSGIEKRIRLVSHVEAESTITIWQKADQRDFYNYTRTKLRILRGTCINMPLITVSLALDTGRYYAQRTAPILYVIIVGSIFSLLAIYGYIATEKNFYRKAKIIEKYINTNRKEYTTTHK